MFKKDLVSKYLLISKPRDNRWDRRTLQRYLKTVSKTVFYIPLNNEICLRLWPQKSAIPI